MTHVPILVPAANLTLSPANVRKHHDEAADQQLEAMIAERGIIQNLVGVPIARKKGHYRITAGGRRLLSVHRLIDKGIFAPDYAVPVLVLGDAKDAIEISLIENFSKLNMNPADECRAFQDIIQSENKTPADVATRFGVTERFVLGRLRLADLAEPVFDALRNGEITLDVAMAYASSSDQERQAAVFAQLSQGYYRTNLNEIRRQLVQDTYRGNDPKALLVGRDAYLEAGGRVDVDLFTDAATERWIDGDLLDRLADQQLAAAAEAIKAREGFAEVRVIPSTHVNYNDTWDLRPMVGTPLALSVEEEARAEAIQGEIDAIEAEAEDGDGLREEDERRLQGLEAELETLQSRVPELTADEKSTALAYVVIGQDGQPRVHEQLYVPPVDDQSSGEDDEGDDDEGQDEADAGTARGKPVVSQRLADELAEMKTELIRVHVASDPRFALDLATFFMADTATRMFGRTDLATELRAEAPSCRVSGFESGAAAAAEWTKLDAGLDRSWVGHDDVCDRYDAFCALPEDARAHWLGWTIARTINAVPDGKTGSGFLRHIGRKLEIDVPAWWRPTARNYFDRISKAAILAQFEEIGGAELSQRYAGSKKHELAKSAERLFAGDIIVDAEVKARALAWVPDAMAFESGPPDATVSEDDEESGHEQIEPATQGEPGGDVVAEAA
jgi:ParB family chromosome partitioning protein